MARGFESKETEGIERLKSSSICEAYACSELAEFHAGGKDLCPFHYQEATRGPADGPVDTGEPSA